jgi:hypothetical protein
MWILSHVGLVENELVDDRKRQVALVGTIFDRPLSSSKRFLEFSWTGIDESMAGKMGLRGYW